MHSFPDVPAAHAAFLTRALERLQRDPRVIGVGAGGSLLTKSIDEFSDLDLVIASEPTIYETVLNDRNGIAACIGPLLASFTGEHVGEPRLLVCLYGPPLLHVDLKFISLADAASRVEDPLVLWERDGRFSAALCAAAARYPQPDVQWIEDRFWVWIHYAAAKLGRGELFEVIDSLAFLRAHVLGPLALVNAGGRPTGVRKIEFAAPAFAREMQATVATYDVGTCAAALRATVQLYRDLRAPRASDLKRNTAVEDAAMTYLAEIEKRCRGAR